MVLAISRSTLTYNIAPVLKYLHFSNIEVILARSTSPFQFQYFKSNANISALMPFNLKYFQFKFNISQLSLEVSSHE